MVKIASTFGRSGTHDFILLRASALILASYAIFMIAWFVTTPVVHYAAWVGLFGHMSVKIYTLLALTALLIHAWIGIWQVLTDYVKNSLLRGVIQYLVVISLFVYWFTGVFVLWGV